MDTHVYVHQWPSVLRVRSLSFDRLFEKVADTVLFSQGLPICSCRVSICVLGRRHAVMLLIGLLSLYRVKAILFVLLRSFVFSHCDPRPNFIKKLSL